MTRNSLAFALVAAAAFGSTARAGDKCGIIMEECPIDELMATGLDDRCERSSAYNFCYPENSAPPHAQLNCKRSQAGFWCSAWPKTADPAQPLSYKWRLTGNLQFAPAGTVADAAQRTVRCSMTSFQGTVEVEVISPKPPYLSSKTTVLLDCEQVPLP